MTAVYFIAYLLLTVALLVAALFVYLPGRQATATSVGLLLWLGYAGLLSHAGVIADGNRRPPGIVLLAIPLTVVVVLAVRSSAGAALPLWLLIGFQTFRVGVELLLHRLWADGLVPSLMTYERGNWDILVGLSAPIAAWLTQKGPGVRRALTVWNAAGLLLLANIALRAVLTSPGPLNILPSEVTNRAIGIFPFTYVAGFFAPLALVLHMLALRKLRRSAAISPLPGSGKPRC